MEMKWADRSIENLLFLLSYCLMTVMTIFNGNTYLAGLSFVWLPSMLLLFFGFFMKKKIELRFFMCSIALFLSAILSTFMSDLDLTRSTFINLLFCIFSYVVVSSIELEDQMFRYIFLFYINFSLIVCLVILFNYIFSIGIQVYNAENIRVTIEYFGIAKDVNYLSAFVLPTFAYHLYSGFFSKNKSNLIKAAFIFVAMFVAGSRACFLSMLLSAMIIICKVIFDTKHNINKPIIIFGLLFGALGLYAIVSRSAIFARTTDFEGYSDNSRLLIWEYALEGFYKKPLIGSGVEAGSWYSLQHTNWKTHNCFIDILTGQGIIGALIMIKMIVEHTMVSKTNKVFMIVILISFFLPLFFVNGYECATFWMPMTICTLLYKKCKKSEDILTLLDRDKKNTRFNKIKN